MKSFGRKIEDVWVELAYFTFTHSSFVRHVGNLQ